MEAGRTAPDLGNKGDVGLAANANDRAAAAKLVFIVIAVREGHKLRHIDLAGDRMSPAPEQIVAVQALDHIGALPAEAVAAVAAEKAVPTRVRLADVRRTEIVNLG